MISDLPESHPGYEFMFVFICSSWLSRRVVKRRGEKANKSGVGKISYLPARQRRRAAVSELDVV